MTTFAFAGASVFDGRTLHDDRALLVADGKPAGIVPLKDIPRHATVRDLDGGTVVPGLVDLQVNGGGGILFNDETSVDGLKVISAAHRSLGTEVILPTLITDTPERTEAAVKAAINAVEAGVPGIAGLHLEGPHLSPRRSGAHDPQLMRPMESRDEDMLVLAAGQLPNLMVTVAPESVRPEQIARLSREGVVVSLGHTNCSHSDALAAFRAGARCVTHLFNAMSQLESRAPGLVGAALTAPGIAAGIIADGIHVAPASIQLAVKARGHQGMFLVTDAMATAGSDIREFRLNNRRVVRSAKRLTMEDGTLAGADLDLPTAIGIMVKDVGLDLEATLRMATVEPASLLRPQTFPLPIQPGRPVSLMHLSSGFRATRLAFGE